jgi:hypothetical protein
MAAVIAIDKGTILVLITLVVLPIAAVAFARSGPLWRRVGKGAFAIEEDPMKLASARANRALQETEARQMLEARSYRRVRNGQEPIDVEAEMKKLLDPAAAEGPTVDAELRAEVRRLVIAGNERRMRRGEEPLDVDAETERQLADFVGSG